MQVSSAMSVGKFSCLGGARRWLGAVRKQNLYATGEETPMWMQKKTSTRVRKVAPKWNSIVDLQREKHLTELNSSKWRERFIQTHLHAGKISQENWGEGRHEMEKDEPCFKQKPLGHPNWYMGDRIWPVAMLQRNVIYVSVFLEKLTLVLVPGSALNHLAVYVQFFSVIWGSVHHFNHPHFFNSRFYPVFIIQQSGGTALLWNFVEFCGISKTRLLLFLFCIL